MINSLAETKASVQKRQRKLKELGHTIKLADLYEAEARTHGFDDWNTYAAKLKDADADPIVDFSKPFACVHRALFKQRSLLMEYIPNDLLAALTRAMNDIYTIVNPPEEDEEEKVEVEVDYPTKDLKFFGDVKGFIEALKAVKSGRNVCFKCRTTETPFIYLRVKKDLKAAKWDKKQPNEDIHLCRTHAAEYMNSFNRYCNPGKTQDTVWTAENLP